MLSLNEIIISKLSELRDRNEISISVDKDVNVSSVRMEVNFKFELIIFGLIFNEWIV